LPGEMPRRAPLVGFADGDVQPRVADCIPGVLKAAGIAELGEDRDRRQLADPVDLVTERVTADLLAAYSRRERSNGPSCRSIASII